MILEPQKSRLVQNDFDMAKLLLSSGSVFKSLPYFEKCLEQFKELEDFESYISCYLFLTNVLFELQDKNKLKFYKAELEKMSQKSHFLNQALVPAFQAYYNIYLEPNFEISKKQLNKALKLAIAKNEQCFENGDMLGQQQSRFEVMLCLYFYSLYYYETENYKSCLKELENLEVLIKDYIKLKTKMEQEPTVQNSLQGELRSHLLSNLIKNFSCVQSMRWSVQLIKIMVQINVFENYKPAERMLWNLYEEVNQTHLLYFVPYIFCYMAFCCIQSNNTQQAVIFLDLSEKNAEPERKQFFDFLKKIRKMLEVGPQFQDFNESEYDIIFDIKQSIVIEKDRGCFNLKNKFVLMDLLKLFLSNPGVPYSKEQIIEKVWAQEYSPQVHDNKLYVTIKRLREIVEDNSCRPSYICRNHAGYYFSPTAKVLIKPE